MSLSDQMAAYGDPDYQPISDMEARLSARGN